MSVPPELMRLMAGGGQAGGGAPGGQPGMLPKPNMPPPPGAAGMATPQKKAGEEGAARTNIQISMNMMEQALPVFGSESEEGKVILKALMSLANKFGKDSERNLVPAQIMQLMKAEPSMGGGMMQKMMQQGGGQPQAGGQPPQPGA